jgi:uncharacterized cofD-like protein
MRPLDVEPDVLEQALSAVRRGPRVVAIGGGKGLARALQAMTRYAGSITAIVTVADDGGSSGRLAPALEIPPPGDIRKCLIALTPEDSVWKRLFEYRFESADVSGHSLGNLIIASLADLEGDFEQALRLSQRLLGSTGAVVPVSALRLHLKAVVDGATCNGQVAVALARGHVESIWVEPRHAEASASAVEAIDAAEQIVLGPGSLYTSILASLVVPGIVEAINASEARLVYVANLTTQVAETLDLDAADHLDALLGLSGVRPPSTIVANTSPLTVAAPMRMLEVDAEVMATYGADVVFADLVDPADSMPRHDPARLGGVLGRLIGTDPKPRKGGQ